LDIAQRVTIKLLELIIARKHFSKASSYLSNQKLLFPSTIKRNLKRLHENGITNNFVNEIEFKEYILSLNFDSAKELFHKKQLTRKERKKNKSKISRLKKNKKGYKTPIRQKLSVQEKIKELKAIETIGLGVKSVIKIPKVKSIDVVIDKNTEQEKIVDKSILYAAGWSLSNENYSD
jgi:hypothetical protein